MSVKRKYVILAERDHVEFEKKTNDLLDQNYAMIQDKALVAKGIKNELVFIREFVYTEPSLVEKLH